MVAALYSRHHVQCLIAHDFVFMAFGNMTVEVKA